MCKLKVFTHSLLLATTPSLLVYPQDIQPKITFQEQSINNEEQHIKAAHMLTYDEIIRLLDEIESGEIEKNYFPEEIERIKHFIAFLAKEGALPDDSEESLSLDGDIEELLNGEDNSYEGAFSFGANGEYQYMIVPAVLHGHAEIVLCQSWVQKQFKHIKKFTKKHKKALIIGAAVVVAAVVVVAVVAATATAGAAAASAAGAAGAAASSGSDKSEPNKQEEKVGSPAASSVPVDPTMTATEAPTLKSAIDNQISSFKDTIVKEQFLEPANPIQQQELSWEENGRALGSLFAHDSLKNLQQQIPDNPILAHEIQNIGSQYQLPIHKNVASTDFGHPEIDRRFSTDYSYLYANQHKEADFNTLSYQVRGERALAYGYYEQAVQDLGKAIEMNPTIPLPYLERGIAHFGLGQYDHSLADYHQFTSQTQNTQPLSIPDFSRGFAKGLPRGIYDSGSGIFLFVSDLVQHPINTGAQMWEALTLLSNLAQSEQWSALSEALAPEVHLLVQKWDRLPSEKRGELAGYAFGKYGADILIPGALAQAVSKGLKGAQELSAVYKGLQTAEQTLVLESVAGLENGINIGEVVRASQTTIALGKEVGFTAREMALLKQAGKLEGAINSGLEKLVSQSESEVLKAAISQDKHVKMIRDYLDKPAKEIQKGVNSYEKQIAIHKDKIENPTKYYPDWDKLDPRQREALINKKWPAEIKGYEEQRSVLQSILNERLSYER